MNTKFSSLNNQNGDDPFPPVGKDVSVLHDGRQRTAYRDSEGNWRDFYNGNILLGEVQIVKVL